MKIDHIGLSVSNIRRSAAFYKKHFGFRCARIYIHKDIGMTIAVLKRDGICLELFEFKKHKKLPGYRKTLDSDLRTLGVKHFSFGVKDIKGAYTRLRHTRLCFATDMRPFDNGLRYFFVKDPDGILIEVMESK
ncbi:MAG: VOC family protein [Candidatus Omnitrophica bacterium]|nr:VOC family protein [Candidatus Omnitrophota bacterium]